MVALMAHLRSGILFARRSLPTTAPAFLNLDVKRFCRRYLLGSEEFPRYTRWVERSRSTPHRHADGKYRHVGSYIKRAATWMSADGRSNPHGPKRPSGE